MIAEILDMADYLVWEASSDVHGLLRTDLSFARSEELARIYDVSPWDGSSAPPAFARGERPGLLTRGARLVNASGATRPIMRGVFVRRTILCDNLPDPPADAFDDLPELDPSLSARQVVVELTEQGGNCAGCHQSALNPIGFMLEGYDGLGRKRSEEIVYGPEGEVLAIHPVDDRATPQIEYGNLTPGQGADDLARRIEESGKFPACLARQYFRFTTGRLEDDRGDGCSLERMRRSFTNAGFVRGMRAIAADPAFGRRKL